MTDRELFAYGLIGACLLIAIPAGITLLRRRRLRRLRRMGIKRYGH